MKFQSMLTIATTALLSAPALADEAGKNEYMNACAACHGEDGQGTGPVSEYMTIVVPSLTGLSAANDGVFPL